MTNYITTLVGSSPSGPIVHSVQLRVDLSHHYSATVGRMALCQLPRALPLSRSSRKRKRQARRRRKERTSRRQDRRTALEARRRELELFGLFINTIGVDLLIPCARIQCP